MQPEVVYTVGRFQPPTLGHIRMIDKLLEIANGKPAFVFVSSARESLIPVEMKMEYLTKMMTRNGSFPPNLHLVDTSKCTPACGGPLGGWKYIKENLGKTGKSVRLVVGSDQAANFDPERAPMWTEARKEGNQPSMYVLERAGPGAASFSSTNAREALKNEGPSGLTRFLQDGTNAVTSEDVKRMATDLLKVQARWPQPKKGGADDEPDMSAFDADYDGGRRRRRTRRSKASNRALSRRGLRSRNGSSKTSRFSY